MQFPTALRALNHRDFRLFWIGQSISSVGSWMQSVGLSWLVLELTNSPFRLGLVSALQFAPVLLFSAVAGVVVDRTPKRRLILATQMALMLPAFALAALDVDRLGALLARGHSRGSDRARERARHAVPAVLPGRDGRPRGSPERHRAQLGHVQRRARRRPRARRAPHRALRHGGRVPAERALLPGGRAEPRRDPGGLGGEAAARHDDPRRAHGRRALRDAHAAWWRSSSASSSP